MQVSELTITDEHDTISKGATLSSAATKVLELQRGVLVILEDNKPLGILTDGHLLLAISKELDCSTEKCEDHMDDNILCVKVDTEIKDITMDKKPIAIIVVDDDGMFSGYFSPNDYRESLVV